ncbi:MAG: acyloxyacyl hydrolase [Bacteroidia bacterium]
MKIKAFLVCVGLLFTAAAFGQDNTRFAQHEVGIKLSFSFINEKMPEGYYQPVLLQGYFGWHLGLTENIANKNGHFIAYLEPQINPVFVSGELTDIEFGCNFGARYDLELSKTNRLYWAIGTGPHYVTVDTKMQHRGYIFSDNFIMGWQHQWEGPIYSTVQYHFRHISNANLMRPNKGLDNHFLTLGISKIINYD